MEDRAEQGAAEVQDAQSQLRDNNKLLQSLEGELKDKRRELTAT